MLPREVYVSMAEDCLSAAIDTMAERRGLHRLWRWRERRRLRRQLRLLIAAGERAMDMARGKS
jgi:hypothetical protein